MERVLKVLSILMVLSLILPSKHVKAEGPVATPYWEVDRDKCSTLNMRETPDTSRPPIGRLVPGCVVRVVRKVGDWYEIGEPWKWWLPTQYVHGYYIKPLRTPDPLPFDSSKRIEIHLDSQTLVAYEGDHPVFSAKISTGVSRTPTPKRVFQIQYKLPASRMTGPGYDLWSPWTMYFHGDYAIHGTWWHNQFGTPRSRGCVNLAVEDARWLYSWASLGTRVDVY